MKIYTNILKLRLPADERYKAHQQIDTLIQERLSIKLPYSWRINPFPGAEQYSLVQIKSGSPLGLPGEVAHEQSFTNGALVSFSCELNSEIRLPLKEGQKRPSGKHGSLDEVLALLNKIAPKNGFEVIAAEPIDEALFKIKKPKLPVFTLGHHQLSIVAKIIDHTLFEIAATEGIGKKRMFGFGLIHNLAVI
jgi:hypothetical protein